MDRARPFLAESEVSHRLARKISDWKPARFFPETYPGQCPEDSYLLLDDYVYPLESVHPLRMRVATPDGLLLLDQVLSRLGLPNVRNRYPVLAYGANRNPATLKLKLLTYGSQTPGKPVAMPLIRASVADADVVAGGLYGQGYFYAHLLRRSEFTGGTLTNVWIALPDIDQLRAIHDSEGVRDGLYSVHRCPGVFVPGCSAAVAPLAYVSRKPPVLSPVFKSPIAFKEVSSAGRRIVAMNALEMMAHMIEVFDLAGSISAITGLIEDDTLAFELSKYLNGQWWYHFHTGNEPISGYTRILKLFDEVASKISSPLVDSASAEPEMTIPPELAYSETLEFTTEVLFTEAAY